jgi:hypothetical protein
VEAADGRRRPEAVRVDDEVIEAPGCASSRSAGRKTLEVEILKEALAAAGAEKPLLRWPSPDPDGSR